MNNFDGGFWSDNDTFFESVWYRALPKEIFERVKDIIGDDECSLVAVYHVDEGCCTFELLFGDGYVDVADRLEGLNLSEQLVAAAFGEHEMQEIKDKGESVLSVDEASGRFNGTEVFKGTYNECVKYFEEHCAGKRGEIVSRHQRGNVTTYLPLDQKEWEKVWSNKPPTKMNVFER